MVPEPIAKRLGKPALLQCIRALTVQQHGAQSGVQVWLCFDPRTLKQLRQQNCFKLFGSALFRVPCTTPKQEQADLPLWKYCLILMPSKPDGQVGQHSVPAVTAGPAIRHSYDNR
jgi:hypothetical protein